MPNPRSHLVMVMTLGMPNTGDRRYAERPVPPRCPLPESLVTETNQLIDDIRTNGVTKKKREELYDTILKLTETGVDFFFWNR